jgi:hypothetical protein
MRVNDIYSHASLLMTNLYNICPSRAELFQKIKNCASRALQFLFDTNLIVPLFASSVGAVLFGVIGFFANDPIYFTLGLGVLGLTSATFALAFIGLKTAFFVKKLV